MIKILWKDPYKKTLPASAQIAGATSRWKSAHNISLGTSLKELELLNGQPFHLAGFGWDYSGTVLSWDQGTLAQELGEVGGTYGRTILRLDYSSESKMSHDEVSQVLGDGSFSSHHPVMQKINPKVYQMIWVFP